MGKAEPHRVETESVAKHRAATRKAATRKAATLKAVAVRAEVGQGGKGGGSQGTPCTWAPNNPCAIGEYCNAPGCGAGQCEPVPTLDNSTKAPVCGCDDVNYWNADTAAVHGMATKAAGVCAQGGTFCGGFGNLQCPMTAHHCDGAVNSSGECLISDPGGSCWGMPKTCSQIGFGGNRRMCNNQFGACMYECDAIKSGMTHFQDNNCPM